MIRAAKGIFGYLAKGKVKAIENIAIQYHADAIVLSLNSDESNNIPEWERYGIYKKFTSREGTTVIYRLKAVANEAYQDQSQKHPRMATP
jgi:hypothetical protein